MCTCLGLAYIDSIPGGVPAHIIPLYTCPGMKTPRSPLEHRTRSLPRTINTHCAVSEPPASTVSKICHNPVTGWPHDSPHDQTYGRTTNSSVGPAALFPCPHLALAQPTSRAFAYTCLTHPITILTVAYPLCAKTTLGGHLNSNLRPGTFDQCPG